MLTKEEREIAAAERGYVSKQPYASETDVKMIRFLYNKRGMLMREIAEKYNLSTPTVHNIIRGKRYYKKYGR